MELATIITAVVSSLLAAISFAFSLYTYRKTMVQDRKQETLDAYNRLQIQAFDHLNLYMPSMIREIAKDPKSEEYKKISSYVARIEHFCVGINQNIYDSKVVYELAHGYLDGAIKSRIKPILESKSFNGEVYYDNTIKVLEWMEKETENRQRKTL